MAAVRTNFDSIRRQDRSESKGMIRMENGMEGGRETGPV